MADNSEMLAPPLRSDGEEARFHRLLDLLPSASYTCDREGRITDFNRLAVELWGREPRLNNLSDRYCGSYKLFATDGARIPHDRCWMALALRDNQGYNQRKIVVERPDGSRRDAVAYANPIHDELGRVTGAVNILVDVTESTVAEEEVRRLNRELEERVRERTASLDKTSRELRQALDKIRTLRGLIPICSWCKKIRDDAGFWRRLESYLSEYTEAEFTHGICPDCAKEQFDVVLSDSGDFGRDA